MNSFFTFDASVVTKAFTTSQCRVMKLADMPSYLGGGDNGIK